MITAVPIKFYRDITSTLKMEDKTAQPRDTNSPLSNEHALLELTKRTGYAIIQENGQRKYGGPPPGWSGVAPPRGCEAFIGKIPRDVYEDELVPFLEKAGTIYELRLMMDFSGTNRGFGFVTYSTEEETKTAVKILNNTEIRKGRSLGVIKSVDNCRLYVSGIPKCKNKTEIMKEMERVTEGVVDVIVYPTAADKRKNRGFAFIEYDCHRSAAMARHSIPPQLWGHPITFDWAEPEREVDDEIMSKVKILYIRNLMLDTTEDKLEALFRKAGGCDSGLERVKKINDYAFIHFRSREEAQRAMDNLNNTTIDGALIEVAWAKPVDRSDPSRLTRSMAQLSLGPSIGLPLDPSQLGYPIHPSQFTPFPAPIFATRTSIGVRHNSRGRGRGAAGVKATGGRSYINSSKNSIRNYKHTEGHMFDLTPDMILTPTNPVTLKPQTLKSLTQLLEEVCTKNGWGAPSFQLHSAARDNVQLFLYKVTIPALAQHSPNGSFTPSKLMRNTDEAKELAAEFVLNHLGIPLEAPAEILSGYAPYPTAAMGYPPY